MTHLNYIKNTLSLKNGDVYLVEVKFNEDDENRLIYKCPKSLYSEIETGDNLVLQGKNRPFVVATLTNKYINKDILNMLSTYPVRWVIDKVDLSYSKTLIDNEHNEAVDCLYNKHKVIDLSELKYFHEDDNY